MIATTATAAPPSTPSSDTVWAELADIDDLVESGDRRRALSKARRLLDSVDGAAREELADLVATIERTRDSAWEARDTRQPTRWERPRNAMIRRVRAAARAHDRSARRRPSGALPGRPTRPGRAGLQAPRRRRRLRPGGRVRGGRRAAARCGVPRLRHRAQQPRPRHRRRRLRELPGEPRRRPRGHPPPSDHRRPPLHRRRAPGWPASRPRPPAAAAPALHGGRPGRPPAHRRVGGLQRRPHPAGAPPPSLTVTRHQTVDHVPRLPQGGGARCCPAPDG